MAARRVPILIGLFTFAWLIRFVYLLQMSSSPFFDFLQLDPLYYFEWARRIAGGAWVGHEVFEMSPLYSYLLAIYMSLFGEGTWVLRLLQIGVGSATCVMTCLLGERYFGFRTGLVAGFGCALYGPFFFYEGQVMKEFLTPALATGSLLLLTPYPNQQVKGARLAGAGALLALASLVRDNFLLLLAILAVWLFFESARDIRRPIIFAAGAALVLMPVGLRNFVVSGDLVLTTSGGGEVFYIGNSPYANGAYVPPPWVRSNPHFEHQDFRDKAVELAGHELSRGEASRFWWGEGLKWLAANPVDGAGLWVRKFALFWNNHELPDNYSYSTFRQFSPLLVVLLSFGPVAAFAWGGMILSAADWRRLMPNYLSMAGYMLTVLITFNFARFRLPVVPLLLVFAAHALVIISDIARRRTSDIPRVKLATASVIILAAFLFTFIDLSSASEEPFQDRLHLGAAYRQTGDLVRAEEVLRLVVEEAEAIISQHGGDLSQPSTIPGGATFAGALSAGYRDLGGILQETGRPAEAVPLLEKAVHLTPGSARAWTSLGAAMKSAGDLRGSAQALSRAVAIDKSLFAAGFDLATVYYEAGQYPDALTELDRALRDAGNLTDFDSADYHYGRGTILFSMEGRDDEAIVHFERGLELNPDADQAEQVRSALTQIRGASGAPVTPE